MRTTVEIKDEHRAKLLELAARRGEKGFSSLVAEAIEMYLDRVEARTAARKKALELHGTLSEEQSLRLQAEARSLRNSWR